MKRILLIIGALLFGLSMRAQSVTYTCRYWFDQNFAQAATTTFSDQTCQAELDVGSLSEGLHALHLHVMDTSMKWSAPQSYLFFKADAWENGMPNYVYHCWFDEDFANQQTDALGNGYLLLNVADLEDGMHTVHVLVEGTTLTFTQSYIFMKIAVEVPSAELQYICWFDQDYSTAQTGPLGNGFFELEVSDLPNGIHTVNVQLDNGTRTAPQSYLFYKQPLGGYGIARWEYWLNDDISNRQITNISPTIDTLDIVSLFNVGHPALRSSCFHFHPNGDAPYINAKNQINFRFYDSELRIIDKSAYYVDEQVEQDIVATVFERNTTETFAAPRDNFIKWYRLPLEYGDTVAFKTDKACTMQLFAPSGEEVYTATAGEALVFGGCHAYEDGDYYLAVHDVTGSGDQISVTYQYVHKYAILAYDVHLVGNGGCSTITFQGNGFNSLLDAYLVNYQNDTIHRLDIGHESNTTTTVTFNFYQVNLGVYNAVFQFYDETIRVNGALEVQEPVDIVLTSTVSYPSQFLRNTPCTYTFTITNNGNMSAYAVPIYVYLSTSTMNGISLIEFDGLKLPSLIDGVDFDTLSPSRIEELKEISDVIGDIHHFFIHKTIDEETGDSIIARSNFFFIDFAPFETKTLTLKITANESLDVWMTVPNETVPPLTLHPDREWFGSWCCVKDNWTCLVNTICEVINIANLISNAFPGSPAQVYSGIASCICGFIGTGLSIFNAWKCEGEGSFVGMASDITNSISGAVASCAACFIPSVNKEGALIVKGLVENIIASLTSAVSGGISVQESCFVEKKKKPDCPPGDDEGGESTPVNSLDPNDIYGYLSESGSHYMRQEIQNVQYEIEFENDTTLATAAAHTIIVRDTLDATKFDLNSLAARSVTIGDKRLELNGEQTFARTLDLRPEIYVIAQVNQDYDPTTGIIQWTIQSLDPMTMEPTTNPYQGVLPVNYYGNGVGFIDYSINLKQAFADGTSISNRAGIIFDQNEVIMTPTWTNTIDAVKPTSYIEEVTPMADSLNFNFVSEDSRSGVWYHILYYRNDSTAQEWQVRKAQIFENNFMLHLEDLQTTEYLVMAVDSAGNHEDKLFNAEYVFGLDSLEYYTLTLESQGCGEVNGAGTYLAGSHVTIEAIPDEGCQFEQWNDGNTDNPRTIELVQDTTFVAQFTFDSMGTTQTIAFSEGYNWWSTYIEQNGIDGLSMLQEGLSNNGITIRSQASGYTDYYGEDYGWWGSLTSINNESSYRVVASTPCTVIMTGNAAAPSQHPITLSQGWSWIGYVPSIAMSVDVAMTGVSAMQGDKLKSQHGYSEYYPSYGWFGSLNTIEPGMGLMYYSANSETVTFTYPDNGRGGELKKNLTAENNHWKPNVYAYPDNMTVMAVVELGDTELSSDNYELAAFAANGECRGSVKMTYAKPLHRHVAFLTISGKDAVELSFRLYNTETNEEYYDAEESLDFVANAIVGEADDLYVVHFRDTTGMDEFAGRVQVYPNPVNAGERFSINVADDVKTPVHVEIVNALGVETLRATSVQTPAQLTAPATDGVYTLRITVEGKGTVVRKLVVK